MYHCHHWSMHHAWGLRHCFSARLCVLPFIITWYIDVGPRLTSVHCWLLHLIPRSHHPRLHLESEMFVLLCKPHCQYVSLFTITSAEGATKLIITSEKSPRFPPSSGKISATGDTIWSQPELCYSKWWKMILAAQLLPCNHITQACQLKGSEGF